MIVKSYTEARGNFAATLNQVVDDCEVVVIARPGRQAVAMMPLSEYSSMRETAYLLSNPANAARLRESMAQAEAGLLEAHGLLDPDE